MLYVRFWLYGRMICKISFDETSMEEITETRKLLAYQNKVPVESIRADLGE